MKSKLLSLCLSIVMAIGIWLYVITVVSPQSQDTFRNIPVQMQSVSLLEERGLVITDISHTDVSLQLSGNRTDLIRVDSGNIRVYADVSQIYEAGVHEIAYAVAFGGSVSNSALEIQSRSPNTIQVTVEKKISKKLNVTVDYQGAVPEGYLTDEANIQLSTTSVIASGPQSVLDTIAGARIVIDLSNRTETISANYPFVLVDSDANPVIDSAVTCDVNTIHVSLKISQFKQVPVKFDVLYNGGATPQNASVVPNVDSIQIVGHKNLLADIHEINLGTIDLSQYPADITKRFAVNLPDGVSGISFVDVEIKFTGLETKELSVSEFVPVNVPSGMCVEFQQEPLLITIRGTHAELSAITEGHIRVEVDFSTTREGASTMPVKIVINADAPTNAGAIRSYTIKANMQRA